MSNAPRIKNGLLSFLTLLFTMFIWLPQAQAFQSILNSFNSTYGTAGTRLDQCSTCHASNTNLSLNPYGSDLAAAGRSFSAIENVDSDGDGFTNIVEINALTFPGNPSDFPSTANQPPTADPNGPYNGTVNVPVQFNGSGSSDPDGTIASYAWNFGDGSTDTGVNPTHAYATSGNFTVTLTVTDDAGATDSATTTATIGNGNQAPMADPNGPYTGTVGTPLQFDGTASTDPDGTIVSYIWDFGDGSSGTGATPTHTYSVAGVYNVTLMVTDNEGATDSSTSTATIGEVGTPPPPVPDPTPTPGDEDNDRKHDRDMDRDRDHDRDNDRDNDRDRDHAEDDDDRNNDGERSRHNRHDDDRRRDRDDD